MTNLQATITELQTSFSTVQTMDPCGTAYARLCAILDDASDEALRAAYEAKIKFVSPLALNRMIRRGLIRFEMEG
jgi:hypothetical protein